MILYYTDKKPSHSRFLWTATFLNTKVKKILSGGNATGITAPTQLGCLHPTQIFGPLVSSKEEHGWTSVSVE